MGTTRRAPNEASRHNASGRELARRRGEIGFPGGDRTSRYLRVERQRLSRGCCRRWVAVRASDSASVLDALEFGPGKEANWTSGISAAYDYPTEWVFVSPPVEGWVFVAGGSLPDPFIEPSRQLDPRSADSGRKFNVLLSRLIEPFDDVQYFPIHRVAGYVAWARASQTRPMRIFSFSSFG